MHRHGWMSQMPCRRQKPDRGSTTCLLHEASRTGDTNVWGEKSEDTQAGADTGTGRGRKGMVETARELGLVLCWLHRSDK